MKFLFLSFQIILISAFLQAQQVDITLPGHVKNKFESEFVNASAVSWKSLPKSGNYEAIFLDKGARKRVRYSDKGIMLFSEENILQNQLSSNVKQKVEENFSGYNIKHISRIETSSRVFFRIRLGKRTDEYEVEFELSGKMKSKRRLGKIYREEDDEEEEYDDDDDDHEHEHERGHRHKGHDDD